MVLHAQPQKHIILGMALIGFRAIDRMNDVVDSSVGDGAKQLCFRTALEVFRKLFEQTGTCRSFWICLN
jgi:hypothetical protein